MKEINLVEILKDCPKGTPLYSLLHGEVEFTHIYDGKIYVKGWGATTFFDARGRYVTGVGECTLFPSKDNRDWTTFKAPIKVIERFNPESLKPYDKVLGRDNPVSRWSLAFFSHIDHNLSYPYRVTPGCGFTQVIPYKGNEHLLGKGGEPDEYYRYWEEKENGQTAST